VLIIHANHYDVTPNNSNKYINASNKMKIVFEVKTFQTFHCFNTFSFVLSLSAATIFAKTNYQTYEKQKYHENKHISYACLFFFFL
jgi:hypothetical protein